MIELAEALGAASYAVLGAVTGFLYLGGAGQRYRATYRNTSYGRDESIIRHERVPPTEAFAAGLLWPLVLGFAFCIGFGRMVVRLMRLGPHFKHEINQQLKKGSSDSTAVVVHGGKEEVPWYE